MYGGRHKMIRSLRQPLKTLLTQRVSHRWTSTKTFTPSTLDSVDIRDYKSTQCRNPLLSDNNNAPLFLSITKQASDKLNSISKQDSNPDIALRIKVESGGCHGFQYELNLTDMKDYHPQGSPDDGVPEDTMFVRDGAHVIIDKMSLEILRDSKVDYAHELIGSQFKVVDSPYTKSSCGCGSSFDFDFDKLT